MQLNRHTVWPISIVGALIVMFVLLTTLLQLSRTVYPVNMDMRYMQGYHQVDKSYDQIVADQQRFDAAYRATLITHRHSETPIEVPHFRYGIQQYEHGLTLGKNHFYLQLHNHAAQPVKDAQVSALVSRYDTDEFDQTLQGRYDEKEQRYVFGPALIDHEGRYKVIVRIQSADGLTGYVEKGVFAR
ncbi:MAG: hypothetical protein AB7E49_04080 [Campylobacterales bacterium]